MVRVLSKLALSVFFLVTLLILSFAIQLVSIYLITGAHGFGPGHADITPWLIASASMLHLIWTKSVFQPGGKFAVWAKASSIGIGIFYGLPFVLKLAGLSGFRNLIILDVIAVGVAVNATILTTWKSIQRNELKHSGLATSDSPVTEKEAV